MTLCNNMGTVLHVHWPEGECTVKVSLLDSELEPFSREKVQRGCSMSQHVHILSMDAWHIRVTAMMQSRHIFRELHVIHLQRHSSPGHCRRH